MFLLNTPLFVYIYIINFFRVNTLPRLSINPPEIQKGPLLYIVQTEFTFKVCSLLHCALYLKICIVTISLKPDIMKIMMIHHPKRFTWTLSSSIIKKLSYIHNSSIGMKARVRIDWSPTLLVIGNFSPILRSQFWCHVNLSIFINVWRKELGMENLFLRLGTWVFWYFDISSKSIFSSAIFIPYVCYAIYVC